MIVIISRLIQGGIAAAVAGGSSWAIVTFRRGRGARVARRIPDPGEGDGDREGPLLHWPPARPGRHSGVAQPAERRPVKPMVVGSSPTPGATGADGTGRWSPRPASREGCPGR